MGKDLVMVDNKGRYLNVSHESEAYFFAESVQGPLITDRRNSNEMFIIPWHFKSNEDIITKFK